MPNRNIKLSIMYDGLAYSGWQRLGEMSSDKSIQGMIEKELSIIMKEPTKITGSGRTDKGVHAYAAVANFHTNSTMDIIKLKKELNKNLPEDIRILEVEEVGPKFHSRYSVKSKTYLYRIDNGEKACVFTRPYTFQMEQKLEIKKMEEAAGYLIGKHDFNAFSSSMKDNRTTIREIYSITINRGMDIEAYPFIGKNEIIITITGNGFLYNMVRIIVGTLIQVGTGERKPKDLERIINSKDRSLAGPTAQYQGLSLKGIEY